MKSIQTYLTDEEYSILIELSQRHQISKSGILKLALAHCVYCAGTHRWDRALKVGYDVSYNIRYPTNDETEGDTTS